MCLHSNAPSATNHSRPPRCHQLSQLEELLVAPLQNRAFKAQLNLNTRCKLEGCTGCKHLTKYKWDKRNPISLELWHKWWQLLFHLQILCIAICIFHGYPHRLAGHRDIHSRDLLSCVCCILRVPRRRRAAPSYGKTGNGYLQDKRGRASNHWKIITSSWLAELNHRERHPYWENIAAGSQWIHLAVTCEHCIYNIGTPLSTHFGIHPVGLFVTSEGSQ